MVIDPVCGMEVDEKATTFKSIHANGVYYFCSATCKTEFDTKPEKYIHEGIPAHHAGHYGGYCGTNGCNNPVRGWALYFYIGLLILLLLALFLFAV